MMLLHLAAEWVYSLVNALAMALQAQLLTFEPWFRDDHN